MEIVEAIRRRSTYRRKRDLLKRSVGQLLKHKEGQKIASRKKDEQVIATDSIPREAVPFLGFIDIGKQESSTVEADHKIALFKRICRAEAELSTRINVFNCSTMVTVPDFDLNDLLAPIGTRECSIREAYEIKCAITSCRDQYKNLINELEKNSVFLPDEVRWERVADPKDFEQELLVLEKLLAQFEKTLLKTNWTSTVDFVDYLEDETLV